MEVSEYNPHRQSLLDAIHRFNTATTIMDETIMVPSMLQDITLAKEEQGDRVTSTEVLENNNNLYDSYVLLKSLRHDMKWGINQEHETQVEHCPNHEAPEETGDLVDQFQHHLRGLLSVLTKLTKKANLLTNCYKKEIEVGHSNAGPYSNNIYY
ncbi:mid1-interacting protein 1-B-like [Pseudophryne corroboree]|uniref:mid1-interacting protein 1-B-like n=1 Tax=Pseudophryne corroboree TaxID=495146 RepID=UPI003081A962